MNFGVSPLTGTIYAGNAKPMKNGEGMQWIGKKQDVTDAVLKAAFEHMYYKSKELDGNVGLTVEGLGTMIFKKAVPEAQGEG